MAHALFIVFLLLMQYQLDRPVHFLLFQMISASLRFVSGNMAVRDAIL